MRRKKAHTPGFQPVPPSLYAGVFDVFRELRQEQNPVGGGRGKGFRLADRLIRVVLAELQRDDSRSPQFVPDVLVRLGQLRAHPEFILPREIKRRGDAEARQIRRSLLADAPDIPNRYFVEVEVQVSAADDCQACGLLPFGCQLGDDLVGANRGKGEPEIVLQVRLDARGHGLIGHA